MKDSGFRLHDVTIEGFKAFTTAQTISMNGKHCFLLGRNGLGKSSIIEAIVWCLFGTPPGADVGAVTNKFYTSGECRVELKLRNSDGLWTYERRLPPGGTRARARIVDPQGEELDLEDVFPALSRLGHAAGAHIIVAQSESARRRRTDISDFELVLSSYLGLDPVPDLLKKLEQLLEEQEDVATALAEEISGVKEDLQNQLHDIESSLEELLRNPPWGETGEPTRAETAAKVRAVANAIAGLVGTEPPAAGSTEQILTEAQEQLTQLDNTRRSSLVSQLKQRRSTLATGGQLRADLQENESRLNSTQARLQKAETKLRELCAAASLEQYKEELAELEAHASQDDSRLNLATQALEYCVAYLPSECPVCGSHHGVQELETKISNHVRDAAPEQTSRALRIRDLRELTSLGSQLAEEIRSAQSDIEENGKNLRRTRGNIQTALEMSPNGDATYEETDARLESLRASVQGLEQTLQSEALEISGWRQRISSLRSEMRFHEYRVSEAKLQNNLSIGLQPAQDRYAEFEELVDTVRLIRDAINQAYNGALDGCLPWINHRMTDVFRLLTQQMSFDEIRVERPSATVGPKLVVRVGSGDYPDVSFDPDIVLNGQANSALRLVPYFAFSFVQAEALQMNWFLIDDPSQSFDTSHVELLLELLQQAGSHAQIILATHESDLFEPRIRACFEADDRGMVRVNGFSKEAGPEFAIE